MTVKDERTPNAVGKIILKYISAFEKLNDVRKEFDYAKEILKEKDKRRFYSNGDLNTIKHTPNKLDQVVLQYNKLLAENQSARLQLQELIKIKEEFLRYTKHFEKSAIPIEFIYNWIAFL